MSTTNLGLEEIEINDNIKTTFISKMNNNNIKIDNAYGYLKDNLLENTGKDNLNDAIEYVIGMHEDIVDLQNEINELNSIGNATENDIVAGKSALVQGQTINGIAFSIPTTATSDDIANGKTAYANDGTLITGTASSVEEKTITGHTGAQSVTFTFDNDVANKRIIFFAKPTGTYLRCTSSVQYLVFADSLTNTFGALCHSASSNQVSYIYDRNTNYTITKNGNNVTISGSSSSYLVGGYSSTYTADLHCIAI